MLSPAEGIRKEWVWDFQGPSQEMSMVRLAGVSNLLESLGHTGRRRAVLGHTLNTQTLMKTDEKK